jgi:hypothetical protein
MITALYMGWTDHVSKQWFPLKKMTWNEGKYYTVYLQGMRLAMEISEGHRTVVKAGLAQLEAVDISNQIEVSFKTRMPVNRPFSDITRLERLGLSKDLTQFDPFEYIARSGGRSGADSCDLFPEVTPDQFGQYHFHFGIGAIDGVEIDKYIYQLQADTQLTIENGLIYHQDVLLGTAPGYIADLVNHHPHAIELTVAQINHDIYKFGKLLCHAQIDSKITIPFSDLHYQPLVDVFAISR